MLSMSERGWGVWPSTGSVVLDIPEVTNKYLHPLIIIYQGLHEGQTFCIRLLFKAFPVQPFPILGMHEKPVWPGWLARDYRLDFSVAKPEDDGTQVGNRNTAF